MTSLAKAIGGEKRVIGGPFGSKLTQRDYAEAGVPVIRGGNMQQDGRWVGGDFAYVSEEKYRRDLKPNTARPGDIIVTQRGTLGQVSIVPEHGAHAEYVVSQSQMAVRVDETEASRDFVYYFLTSPIFDDYVEKATIQTGVPHINLGILRDVRVDWPDIKTQVEIARVLASLDDKIELNRRMNETLEEMARAVFRDWFVDFGPTRRQADGATAPAAIMGHAFPPEKAATLAPLFPAKLGDDGLPEGWEVRPLDEIGRFLNGLALQKFPAQDGKPDLPVIKIAELRNGVTAKSNRASTDVPPKYVIGNGDFIFSWSGSLMAKFWTGGAGALNQHLFKVTSESHPMWFVSEWVQTHLEEFQRIAASKAVTMGHIKRSHLAEAMCVCPSDGAVNTFGEVFDPLIRKQIANDEESQTLAKMRDLLLPKLMSGEIRLKGAEAAV